MKEIDYDLWSNVSSPVHEKGYPSYEAVNKEHLEKIGLETNEVLTHHTATDTRSRD